MLGFPQKQTRASICLGALTKFGLSQTPQDTVPLPKRFLPLAMSLKPAQKSSFPFRSFGRSPDPHILPPSPRLRGFLSPRHGQAFRWRCLRSSGRHGSSPSACAGDFSFLAGMLNALRNCLQFVYFSGGLQQGMCVCVCARVCACARVCVCVQSSGPTPEQPTVNLQCTDIAVNSAKLH